MLDTLKRFFLPRHNVAEIIKPTPRLDGWKAYAGDFPDPILATRTDPDNDDVIVIPLIAQIVDTSTANLLGEGVKLDVEGEDSAAQTFLDLFLQRSRHHATIQKAALNGAVTGQTFIKMIVREGAPDRMQVVPSASVTVETDPRDSETATAFTVEWEAPNEKDKRKTDRHREVTYRFDADSWVIEESVLEGGSGHWRVVSTEAWPFAWPPIFDAQNLTNPLAYWGKPDATEAVIRQNQSINTVLSLCARLLRNHAHPKTFLTAMTGQHADFLIDSFISLPEGVTAEQISMDAAGAAALIELYGKLREALHTTSRTPEVASGKLESLGAISGTALSILFRPLTEKTNEKRLHLGELLADLVSKVLFLGGFGERIVNVVWDDTTPKSQTEERETAQADIAMGIASRKTISAKLGYDYDAEQDQIATETPPEPVIAPSDTRDTTPV